MELDFAVDQLYSTGWSALDTRGCGRLPDGRAYPELERIEQEFTAAGFQLNTKHIQLFDCYRAEWQEISGEASGSVVGHTIDEAGVFALSQMRRASATLAV